MFLKAILYIYFLTCIMYFPFLQNICIYIFLFGFSPLSLKYFYLCISILWYLLILKFIIIFALLLSLKVLIDSSSGFVNVLYCRYLGKNDHHLDKISHCFCGLIPLHEQASMASILLILTFIFYLLYIPFKTSQGFWFPVSNPYET